MRDQGAPLWNSNDRYIFLIHLLATSNTSLLSPFYVPGFKWAYMIVLKHGLGNTMWQNLGEIDFATNPLGVLDSLFLFSDLRYMKLFYFMYCSLLPILHSPQYLGTERQMKSLQVDLCIAITFPLLVFPLLHLNFRFMASFLFNILYCSCILEWFTDGKELKVSVKWWPFQMREATEVKSFI